MTLLRQARLDAPAKVNLFLRVLHRRSDGFHDLETLFQAVDLCDEVAVRPGGPGVRLRLEGPDLGPPGENLAFRAASAFLAAAGLEGAEGVAVTLVKRIPAGAGLGGGSSDAAATLRCLDALWPGAVAPPELTGLAAGLGSDVPFFLGSSGLALGKGRGEIVTGVPPLPAADLVLVLPPVHVATGGAYAALATARGREGSGGRAHAVTGALPRSWEEVAAMAENDFQDVVPRSHPEVAASLEALSRAGARPALLSGSGAACFGVFRDREESVAVAVALAAELGWPAVPVRTLERLPRPELG